MVATAQELLGQLVQEVEEDTNNYSKSMASHNDSRKNEEFLKLAITLHNKGRNINNTSLNHFKALIKIIAASLLYVHGMFNLVIIYIYIPLIHFDTRKQRKRQQQRDDHRSPLKIVHRIKSHKFHLL